MYTVWIPSSSTLSTRFLTPAIFLEISHVALTPSGRMIVTELALLEKLIYTSFSNTARPRSSTVLEATDLSSQPANTTLANPCFFAIILNPPCSRINIPSALSPQNLASVYHITHQKINANTHIHNNSVCINYTHAKVL